MATETTQLSLSGCRRRRSRPARCPSCARIGSMSHSVPSSSITIWSRVTLSGGGKCWSSAAWTFISPTGTCSLRPRRAAGDPGQLVEQLVEREHLRAAQLVALARPSAGRVERGREGRRHIADPDRLVAVAAVADHRRDRQPQQALERLQRPAAARRRRSSARTPSSPGRSRIDRLLGRATSCPSSGSAARAPRSRPSALMCSSRRDAGRLRRLDHVAGAAALTASNCCVAAVEDRDQVDDRVDAVHGRGDSDAGSVTSPPRRRARSGTSARGRRPRRRGATTSRPT